MKNKPVEIMPYPGTEIDNTIPHFFMFAVVAGICLCIGAFFLEKYIPVPTAICAIPQVQTHETQEQTPVQGK